MRSCRVLLILLHALLATAQEITFQEEPVAINGSTVDINSITDGRIPAMLTDLEGDTWARDLLTVPRDILATASIQMVVDFRGDDDYEGGEQVIEFVMFNCVDFGIGASNISIYAGPDLFTRHEELLVDYIVTTESCDHLVHLCINAFTTFPVLNIEFFGSEWVHIAEVLFHDQSSPLDETPEVVSCPSTLTIGDISESSTDCTIPIAIFCVITIGVETIFVTIIFIIVQICVCKHFQKTTQRKFPSASGKAKITNGTSVTDSKGHSSSISSSGGVINQRYSTLEQVDGGKEKKASPVNITRKLIKDISGSGSSIDRSLPGIPLPIPPVEYELPIKQNDTATAEYDDIVVDPRRPSEYEVAQDEYEVVGAGVKAPPTSASKLRNCSNTEESLYECISDHPNMESIDNSGGEEEGEGEGDEDGTYILAGDVGRPSANPNKGEVGGAEDVQPPPLYLRLSGKENIDEDEDAYVIP